MEGDWTEEDDETSVAQERLASPVNLQGKSSLLERHYDLCPPTVEGFCLKAKDWGYLDVEDIHDIDWNTTAFDKLVLPHAYRRLVWAWMNAQLSQSDDFDDVIKGKGKGIIMLLSGELGTGKTLTSEYSSYQFTNQPRQRTNRRHLHSLRSHEKASLQHERRQARRRYQPNRA
ncbi:uncharacterized protein IWZ02DRAFT_307550 [Phyllosticta citriasiana]|uniref:uncharacterized protein n=1 Tax=Phyllosticta citriasiana TaxID=595635 RepID=UPI0030FDA71F